MLNESIVMMAVASTSRSDHLEAGQQLCRTVLQRFMGVLYEPRRYSLGAALSAMLCELAQRLVQVFFVVYQMDQEKRFHLGGPQRFQSF